MSHPDDRLDRRTASAWTDRGVALAPLPPRPLRVLVIDDNDGLRRCVAQILQDAGHEVVEAASALLGLTRLQDTPVDAVLTDLQLPDGSGWEVVRAAHALRPGPPVVVMSGSPEALAAGGSAASWIAGALVKPFRLQEILGRLEELAGARETAEPLTAEGLGRGRWRQ